MTLTKRNYVLVDYENTQAIDLDKLSGLPVKLVIFVGTNQKNIPVDLVNRLLQCQCATEIFPSAGMGKNALDFQLAFYAGQIFEKEPEAGLHIVSRDKGFDPLIEHMKKQKRGCSRVDSFQALPFLNPISIPKDKADVLSLTQAERVAYAVDRLTRMPANTRPRKLKTLHNSLHALFSKKLSDKEIQGIVDVLINKGHVVRGEKENVTYPLQT